MKKLNVTFLTLLLLTLCACNNHRIYGNWHCGGNTVVFEKNGNFEMIFWDGERINGTFDVNGSVNDSVYKIVLCDENGRKQEMDVVVDGNSMTLPNGTYKKQ